MSNDAAVDCLTRPPGRADLYGMRVTAGVLSLCSALFLVSAAPLASEEQRGGQGAGVSAAPKPTGEIVRVKAGHANIHTGPTSGNEVLVLAAKGSMLPVLARRGEWIQVGLSPELRKTGMVMRWYKNENNGWIHDSMLEVVKPAEKRE